MMMPGHGLNSTNKPSNMTNEHLGAQVNANLIVMRSGVTDTKSYRLDTGISGSRTRVITNPTQKALYADEGLVMVQLGKTCVAIWRTKPNSFLFDRQVSALSEVINSHSEPIGFLCIVEAKTPAPADDLRRASVEMLMSRKQQLACVGAVIADRGFTSAITRSVLAGMAFVVSRRDLRAKITDSVERAVAWMSNYVDLGTVESYCSVVNDYRKLLVADGDSPPDIRSRSLG